MTNPTSNFGWQMPTSTDLVTDLPADFEVFGQAVDTSLADLKGGTTGQVLKKNTNTDMDFVWAADSAGMTNPMTTTGDTIYSSSGSTPARLGIGSTGNVLTVSGGLPVWAAPAGGGKVLQVVNATTSTSVTSSTSTFVDTNLTASITPSSASSKVLVLVSQSGMAAAADRGAGLRLLRGATTLLTNNYAIETSNLTAGPVGASVSLCYLDTPATTSATTYKTQVASSTNQASVNAQRNDQTSMITLLEIGA